MVGTATTTGRRCLINEDRYLIDTTQGWFAIASSVGGLPYGEQASECAIRQLKREIARPDSDKRELSDIIISCHDAVRQLGAFLAPSTGIGATLTILRFTTQTSPPTALMAHVGDSVAYHHPASLHPLVRLSTDHIIDISSNCIVGDTSFTSQKQPRLDSYLGHVNPPDCEIRLIALGYDDRIILCSNGVTRALDEAEIADLSVAKPSASELAHALVEIADMRGGRANASAIVIDIPTL